jgi:hypothetical protein
MKYFYLLIFCLSSVNVLASEDKFYDELVTSVGMTMVSYAEDAKVIQGDNVQEAASGSVSGISASIQYKMASSFKKSYYLTTVFPLLPSATGTYLSFGGGMEYYFNDIGSKTGLTNSGTTIQFTPKFRYFAGFEVGGGYLVYTTESAKKTDLLFEIGGLGGIAYSMSNKWAIKTTLNVMKGTGAVTSTMAIRFMIGGTFYL